MAERGIFGKIKSVSGVCTLSKEKDWTQYENTRHYKDVEDLLKDVLDIVRDDDTVLVKASRGIMLDRVVELLDKSYED